MKPSDKKVRKPRVNQRDRRQEFLQAAKKMFEERGYESTTLRDVAKAANASVGLVFSYFKGKDELILEIIQSRKEESLAGASKILSQNKSFLKILKEFYLFQLKNHELHFKTQKILLSLALKNEEIGEKWRDIVTERRLVPLLSFLSSKVNAGILPKKTDVQALASIILAESYYIGFIRRFVMGINKKTCKEELMLAAEVLAQGLGTNSLN